MDSKLFLMTFITIFIAEVGDKTQMAALTSAAAHPGQTLTILLAVVAALSLAGALGVLGGKLIGSQLNPTLLRYVSGGLFIVLGLWILTRKA